MKIPLFIVTGTCGAGKSTVVPLLKRLLPMCDVFDMDLINNNNDWQTAQHNWLRIASSLADQHRHVVLCGVMIPEHVKDYQETRDFSTLHYFNLHCDDATRQTRLAARRAPADFIEAHHDFARWMLEHANTAFDPPLVILDATHLTPEESASVIQLWVLAHLVPCEETR